MQNLVRYYTFFNAFLSSTRLMRSQPFPATGGSAAAGQLSRGRPASLDILKIVWL